MAGGKAVADDDVSTPAQDPEPSECTRDPECRVVHSKKELREKMLDKTIADSFPTSDPPSSIPDPSEDDSMAA
jgi:hypothetical protein